MQALDVIARFDGELEPEWLAGRVVQDVNGGYLVKQAHNISHIASAQSSTNMVTAIGELRTNMHILVSTPRGHRVGKIVHFVCGCPVLSEKKLYCVVWVPLISGPCGLWAPCTPGNCCSATRDVVRAIAFARYRDGVKPTLPQLPGLQVI